MIQGSGLKEVLGYAQPTLVVLPKYVVHTINGQLFRGSVLNQGGINGLPL